MVEALFPYEFEIGDKILAYYDGLLYEATCKNRKITDYGEISYFVHYKGFKSTFDEWSDADEVLALNDINLAHKETLESERKPCKRSNKVKKSRGPKKKNYASSPKPAKRKRGRPKKKVDKSAGPALEKFGVPPTAQLKEPVVKIIDVIKFRDPYTEKFLGAALKRFAKPARQAFAGPATSQLAKTVKSIIRTSSEAAVRSKRVKKSQKPRITHDTSSTKPAKKKRGRPKKNVEQTARPIMPATSQFEEPSTTHFAGGPASVQFKELSVKITDMLKFAKPYSARSAELATAQLVEPAVEKSAETAIHKITEPAPIQFAVLATGESEQFSEIQEPHILKYTELDSEQSAKLPTAQLGEPAVEKSAETGIQTLTELDPIQFAGLATGESEQFSEIQEPHIQKYTELDSARSAKLSTAQLGEPAVEKSAETAIHKITEPAPIQFACLASGEPEQFSEIQEPHILKYTELDSAQSAKLPTAQLGEPAVEKSAETGIQTLTELDPIQFAGLATGESEQFSEIQEPHIQKYTELDSARSAKLSTAQLGEPAVEKSAETAIHQITEPAPIQFACLASGESEQFPEIQEPHILKYTELDSAQSAKLPTAQLGEPAVEKSAETGIQTLTELDPIQFAGLAMGESEQFSEIQEPHIHKYTELDSARSAKLSTAQLGKPAVEKSAETGIQTLTDADPIQFAGLASGASEQFEEIQESDIQIYAEPDSAQFVELHVGESDILKFAKPYFELFTEPATEQFSEAAVVKSDETAIKILAEPTITQLAGPASAQFTELAIEEYDLLNFEKPYFSLLTEPFTAQLIEPTVEKSDESAMQTFIEPDTKQFAGLTSAQFTESAVDKSAELAIQTFAGLATSELTDLGKSGIHTFSEPSVRSKRVKIFQGPRTTIDISSSKPANKKRGRPKKNVEQAAGLASTKFADPATKKFAELGVRSKRIKKYQHPWTTEVAVSSTPVNRNRGWPKKNVEETAGPLMPTTSKFEEPFTTQFAGSDSAQFKEPAMKVTDIPKFGEPYSARSAKLATAQLVEPAVGKSAETAIQTFAEPASKQFAGLTSGASEQFAELKESDIQIYAETDSAQFVEIPVEESELLKFAKPATTQSACPAKEHFVKASLEKSTESTIHTFSEPAVRSKRVKKSQEPWLGSTTKPAKKIRGSPKKNVEQAAELATLHFAESASTQTAEPAVEKCPESAIQSFKEFPTTHFAGLASAKFSELSIIKSDIQQFSEPDSAQFKEPATAQFIEPTIQKSAESGTLTFEELSITPFSGLATAQFAQPANTQFAEPATAQFSEPGTSQFTEPAAEKSTEPVTDTFLELPVEVSKIQCSGNFVEFDKLEEAFQDIKNFNIKITPRSKDRAIKLFKEYELPSVLKKALMFDRVMHYTFKKVLKFPKDNCFAEVIYSFTNSSYFIDDDQKRSSMMFCLTLMQYFNTYVHHSLIYQSEIRFRLRIKGVAYFQRRIKNRPNIKYKLKHKLKYKNIWCYLYGPMYLVRLIDTLPKLMISNLWFPNYDLERFVCHIKELSRFLVDNFDTYFTDNDYIDTE